MQHLACIIAYITDRDNIFVYTGTRAGVVVFAEEIEILDVGLRLDRSEDGYTWHGWQRLYLSSFLASLPEKCSLLVGVWETLSGAGEQEEVEQLAPGCVLEVNEGEVRAVRTFDSLVKDGLKPVEQLEADYEDALELADLCCENS